MRKIILPLLLILCINLYSQTTYTWIGSSWGFYTDASNWDLNAVPGENDYILFNSSCTVAICDSFVISKVTITSTGDVGFSTACAKSTKSLTIKNGTASVDFTIQSGGNLSFECPIYFLPNAKAEIYGSLSIAPWGGQTQFISATASGVIFKSGSSCFNGSYLPPFGENALANTVVFDAGSTYEQYSDSSPFALTPPASKVVFNKNSKFIVSTTLYSDFLGRSFGNLEVNVPLYIDMRDTTLAVETNNVSTFNNIIANSDFYFDISAVWGTDKYSKINFTGNEIQINNSSDVDLRCGYGGFSFTQTNFQFGTGDGLGSLRLHFTHYNATDWAGSFNQTGQTFVLKDTLILTSDPYGGSYRFNGTLDTEDKLITGNSGYVRMKDNSTFITANTGGLSAVAPSLSNGVSIGDETYYTPTTTFKFNGTAAQSAGVFAMNELFGIIIIDNPMGVTMDYQMNIDNKIQLQNGNLYMNGNYLTFYYKGIVEEINGKLIGDASATLQLTNYNNTGTLYPFAIPANFTIGNLVVTRGYTVTTAGNLTVSNSLSMTNGSLDISDDTFTLFGTITYDIYDEYRIIGNSNSVLNINSFSNIDLKGTTLKTLNINTSSGIVNLKKIYYDRELIISDSLNIYTGSLALNDCKLVIGGKVNFLTGQITGGAQSRLKILNTNNTNVNLTLSELKSLDLNGYGIISLNNDLTVYDSLVINNSSLDIQAANLTINGFINQSNSEITTNQWGNLIIGGAYTGDCTMMFDATANFNNFVIDRLGGKIHLGSKLRTSSLYLENGKLFLENYDLHFYSCPFLESSNGFDNTRYIVTNGTGSLIMRNCNAKSPVFFPVGSETIYAPVTINGNYISMQYYNISARVLDEIQNVTDTSNWIKNSWVVSVVPDVAGNEVDFDLTTYWEATSEGSGFENQKSYITEFDGTNWDIQAPEIAFYDVSTGLYELTKTMVPNNGTFSVKSCKQSVAPTIVAANITGFCNDNVPASIELSYSGGSLGDCSIARWFTDEGLANEIGTGNNLILTASDIPTDTTTYYLIFEDGPSEFTTPVSVTIYVYTPSIPPSSVYSDTYIFCEEDVANITLSEMGGLLGSGAFANWYSDPELTELEATGESVTITAPDTTTTYYFLYEGGVCNTTAAQSVTVTVNEYTIEPATVDVDICDGQTNELNLSYAGGYVAPDATVTWFSDPALATPVGYGNNVTLAIPDNDTTYYMVIDSYCFNNFASPLQLQVTINEPPNATMTCSDTDFSICKGDIISFTGAGGNYYDYYVNDTISQQGNNNIFDYSDYNDDFSLSLIVSDLNSCTDTVFEYITVNPLPEINLVQNILLNLGDSYTLNTSGNQSYNYYWTPATWMDSQNIYNPTVTPMDTITYKVEVSDTTGCKSEYSVKFDIDFSIIIYDAISPNSDGKNDYWIVENIERFDGNIVEIFDRSGNSIFKKENYENNFDGTNQKTGDLLPFGTYFYIIDLNNGSSKLKGTFMIFR